MSELTKVDLSARVSMILTSLPFPPLPVRVLQDGKESVASGHDLLASAISVRLAAPSSQFSEDMQTKDVRQKTDILVLLHCSIFEVWENFMTQAISYEQACERVYGVYQTAFRAYMALYPGSPDLRILHMDDVDADSTVARQARDHLLAFSAGFVDDSVHSMTCEDHEKYRDTVGKYAATLYTFSE